MQIFYKEEKIELKIMCICEPEVFTIDVVEHEHAK